jgi:hypothetical protein
MAATKTYRNSVNGKIAKLTPEQAAVFPNYIEVDDDAKPLAYIPATPEEVAAAKKAADVKSLADKKDADQ